MGIKFGPLVTESLAKQISEKIRIAILEGRLSVDERLPTEQELARRFKVSRPTIREALKRLAAQNLIRSRRGPTGGTFVTRPSQEEAQAALMASTTMLVSLGEFNLAEVGEARFELERVCCRLAAERRLDEHLDIMAEELGRQRSGELTDEEFCASDVRFHRALVDATGNSILRFVMIAVIEALQPVSNMIVVRFRDRKKIVRQHDRIFKAISDKDVDKAETAICAQNRYLMEKYAEAQEWRESLEKTDTVPENEIPVKRQKRSTPA